MTFLIIFDLRRIAKIANFSQKKIAFLLSFSDYF